MAALTVQNITPTGLAASFVAASAGGDTISTPIGDERTLLQVKNASGSAVTVTINPVNPTTVRAQGAGVLTVPPISVSIPATNGDKLIGPIAAAYIDGSGNINVTYSAVTSVTVAALRLPAASI